jgi:hypothetical protein
LVSYKARILILTVTLLGAGLLLYGGVATRLYRVSQTDSETLPFHTSHKIRLDRSITDLVSYLSIELGKKGSSEIYGPWTVSKIVVGLAGSVSLDSNDVTRFLRAQMLSGCSCWREYNSNEQQLGVSSYVLFALSRLGQPASNDQLQFLLNEQAIEGWWTVYPVEADQKHAR